MLHLTASKTLFAVAFVFILATSSSVPAVVSSATPTPTAIAAQPDLLEFPLPMPSDEQLTEARDCAFAPETHYPSKLTIDELQTAYKVVTACEWAELALAYSTRRSSDDAPLPPQAIAAYLEAVRRNPAIPNSLSMLSVFSAVPLVSAPAFVSQMITQVRLHNRWGGGIAVSTLAFEYDLTIKTVSDKAKTMSVTGTQRVLTTDSKVDSLEKITPKNVMDTVDVALVQALGTALTNLIPVGNSITLQPCTDNYPDWTATITFKDGTVVQMATHRSNIYFAGGPWQPKIKDQQYIQYSNELVKAIIALTEALETPSGETGAQYCGEIEDPLTSAFGG